MTLRFGLKEAIIQKSAVCLPNTRQWRRPYCMARALKATIRTAPTLT